MYGVHGSTQGDVVRGYRGEGGCPEVPGALVHLFPENLGTAALCFDGFLTLYRIQNVKYRHRAAESCLKFVLTDKRSL